jgi:hypothetical protein
VSYALKSIHGTGDPRSQVDAVSLKGWHWLIITLNSYELYALKFRAPESLGMGIHSSGWSFPRKPRQRKAIFDKRND